MNLDGKTKTPAVAHGESEKEHLVIVREGELLQVLADERIALLVGMSLLRVETILNPVIDSFCTFQSGFSRLTSIMKDILWVSIVVIRLVRLTWS